MVSKKPRCPCTYPLQYCSPTRSWIYLYWIYCLALFNHLFLFRNYDVLDQKVWAVALCRELPSPAWRGVIAAV